MAFGGERLRHFLGPFSVSPLGASADHIEGFEEVSAGHLESKQGKEKGKSVQRIRHGKKSQKEAKRVNEKNNLDGRKGKH